MTLQISVTRNVQPRLSGTVYPPTFFRFVELDRFDPTLVLQVLKGEVAGCIFRAIVDEPVCRRITETFWRHPLLKQREDAVPAHFLGAYHYGSSLDGYFESAEATRQALREIFNGEEDLHQTIIEGLASCLRGHGIDLRLAEHQGRRAAECVMRSWSGTGVFSLKPHEDGAQLTQRQQLGFEIQRVAAYAVTAGNICLENAGAGHLHYWNIEPSAQARADLGLEETGYPYPLEELERFARLVVPIHRGDIYFFNGKLVHAVAGQDGRAEYRTTISFLMGHTDPRTVIYWA